MRDGRRQFASGEIIPFLDQHVYPEGGVAEAKRARRREKEAFVRTVFAVNNGGAAAHRRAAQRKASADATAGTAATSKKRPPRVVHRVDKKPGLGGDGAGEGAVGREPPGRAWPYGPVCMVLPTQGREPGRMRRSRDSGRGGDAGQIERSAAANGGPGGAGDAGTAVYDSALPVCLKEGDTVTPGTDAADASSGDIDTGNSSEVNKAGTIADKQDTEHVAEEAAGKRRSGCEGGDRRPDGSQQLQPAILGQQGKESGARVTDQEKAPRAATPSPVVTSSVRVLDMGVVRPSE